MLTPTQALSADGPLAKKLDGFQIRTQQVEMAEVIATALDEEQVLITEAGTGTGKTMAYLIPALLSGKKVIVSTGTKNLQDQLYHRDLPLACDALGLPVRTALLKGRANYLCRHRLTYHIEQGRLRNKEQVVQLNEIASWANRTRSGDIAEMDSVPEDAQVWSMATSNAENCLGAECPQWDECHLVTARREAQEADILVINHHLLFADMVLKQEGFGELLPGANAFIIDEAHQIPDVASNFFGINISGRQLLELAKDSITEQLRDAKDAVEITKAAENLETAVRKCRLALGEGQRRAAWKEVQQDADLESAIDGVDIQITRLEDALEPAAERGKGLEACWRRSGELKVLWRQLTEASVEEYIHWFETYTQSFVIHLTPLQVSESFREQLERYQHSWIFTSATLAVEERFDHFMHQLGIEEAVTHRWESPFDYPRQAVFYAPEALPDPNDRDYTAAIVDAALPILEMSRGRAFMLFTSYRALNEAADRLAGRVDYPLFIQGDAPRGDLLDRFREHGNGILLGTGSFWEGVDVRGEALSLVIIDKLPFSSPGDPVLQARIDAMRQAGGNPFMDYQLPQAVISLKQGVGRLIRDERDYGVLMLCDPRLTTKSYGSLFLRSLPAMTRTRKSDVVQRFFNHIDEHLKLEETA